MAGSSYFVGKDIQTYLENHALKGKRYIFGLRRDEEGTLYLGVYDMGHGDDSFPLFDGDTDLSFEAFELGGEWFEGRNEAHEVEFPLLTYEQWKSEGEKIAYYIDSNGNFVKAMYDRPYETDV